MRQTKQRQAILTTLQDEKRPLSPAEIAEIAAREVAGLNLATVYRNLKAMSAAGELTVVECVGQPARYELAGLGHHHHFHCEDCDRLFDLPACDATIDRLAPAGFAVRTHHIQLSGSCEECATG